MKEDPNFERGRPQVADQLHSVSPGQFFCRFVFNNHSVIHDHVESLPGHVPAFVPHVHDQLANDNVATVPEFILERTGINALAQAVPVVVVHGKEATDNRMDPVGLEQFGSHSGHLRSHASMSVTLPLRVASEAFTDSIRLIGSIRAQRVGARFGAADAREDVSPKN
jgi:hypothetical protein